MAFRAPPGTTIDSIQWGGEWGKSADCGWSAELIAVNLSQGWTGRLMGTGPNESCSSSGGTGDGTVWLGAPGGTTAIYQQVVCGRANCSGGGWSWMKTRYARVVLLDHQGPTAGIGNTDLGRVKWIRGNRVVEVGAQDNLGIRRAELLIDGRREDFHDAACVWARPVPCPPLGKNLEAQTGGYPDGRHTLELAVLDTGGLSAIARKDIFIDNTAPKRVDLAVSGGEGWRRRNGNFEVTWTNPAEAHAPLTGVRYRICRVGTTECHEGAKDGAIARLGALEVPSSGDWTLELWRVDEAGNGSDSDAQRAPGVHLRLDTESPDLAFEPQDPDDPLRLAVKVGDSVSGVETGAIELRRKGGRAWHEVDAHIEKGLLTGYVDDQRFADGPYELRAHATDYAGNTGSTDRQANGASAGLTLPVRVPTILRAGARRARVVRRTVRRGGRRRTVRRRVSTLAPTLRVGIGRRITLEGRLTNPDGQPIDGASIGVSGKSAFGDNEFASLGLARTDASGRFTYRARATESRVIRFEYAGARQIRAAVRDVFLRVPASSSISVSDRRVLNGQGVRFAGRLRGGAIPAGGKLLEVQAFFRGRWRTFSTVRSDAAGRWKFNYRFGGTSGRITYRFRVVIPHEGGYPFDTGHSPVVRVHVRGP